MDRDSHAPIGITALRAVGVSEDGTSIILSLTVKYSRAERTYTVPIDCFEDLIVDLRRLNATAASLNPGYPAYILDAAE